MKSLFIRFRQDKRKKIVSIYSPDNFIEKLYAYINNSVHCLNTDFNTTKK